MLTVLDLINLIGSIASLFLAIISIWLALYFYKESKRAEKEASNLLTRTEQQITLLNKVSHRMLDRFVAYSTNPKQADEVTMQLMSILNNSLPQAGISGGDGNNKELDQVTVYIATAYWSGIANVSIQQMLPVDVRLLDADEISGVSNLLSLSKHDYHAARTWLRENGGDLIQQSPASKYYDYINNEGLDYDIRDALETYKEKRNDEDGGS